MNNDNKVCEVKSKNIIILDLLVKSKLLIESNSRAGFLTFGAKLAFIKLR